MDTADVLIVGAGPAGLAAATTLASEGRSVILLEKRSTVGGQAATSTRIENYLPFPGGLSGEQFAADACEQCCKFGVDIRYNCDVRGIIPNCSSYTLDTSQGYFHGRVVLLALGLSHKPLNVPGAGLPDVYSGMNKSALADLGGKRVAIIGGGNGAGQASCYYQTHGAHVTLIVRHPIRETMSKYLVDRIVPNAEIIIDEVAFFKQVGEDICIRTLKSNVSIYVDCVHLFIGQGPDTSWLRGVLDLDEGGYILVDGQYRTSCPGVFAVGDVTSHAVRRMACAVGRANEAVPFIHVYLDSDKKIFACSLDIQL